MSSPYEDAYRRSIEQPDAFWGEQAQALHWFKTWDTVLDLSQAPMTRWFTGAETNVCFNALDRHADGERGAQLALVYDSPVTAQKATFSYRQLRARVAQLAGALRSLGVETGDRVLIYMPNMPEAVMGMLACARLGAVHSVVFGGFAANELAKRLDDAQPVVVLSASCGIEPTRVVPYKPLLDLAIELSSANPKSVVVLQRPQAEAALIPGRDLDWGDLVRDAEPVDCVSVPAGHPLFILYTSGTTGVPKGVVHDHGGYQVALAWSMKHIYDVDPGQVYWAGSDVGWVVGHSYIVYGPLLHGCTTVLYEGKPVGTPDAAAFWRVMAEHRVDHFFTAPTAIRAIKREDPHAELLANFDLSCLKTLFLAGERADPDTLVWAEEALGIPIIDHWWQTETGWPMASNCLGLELLPIKHGSSARAVPGYRICVLSDEGQPVKPGEIGNIVVKLPLPPGALPTLWENDAGFVDTYLSRFEGHYETMDAGLIDDDGYVWIMSRTDDIINVAGHRLSTGAIEEVLASHTDVAECAVIGPADSLKGQIPFGFVVLNAGADRDETEVMAELVAMVRQALGAVIAFKRGCVVNRLPKTRSGKVLRGTMLKIADSTPWTVPPTIDDPAILDEIEAALKRFGYAS